MDENHKYGLVTFRRGYVFCNCKGCNKDARPPKRRSHRRPDEEPAEETNWSRV